MRFEPLRFALNLAVALLPAGARPAPAAPAPQHFLQEVALHHEARTGSPTGAIAEVALAADGSVRARAHGRWLALRAGGWEEADAPAPGPSVPPLPAGARLAQLAVSPAGDHVAATDRGLFHLQGGDWKALVVDDGLGRHWAAGEVAGAVFDSSGRLWFATRAGVGVQTPAGWRLLEGKDGLPWNEFTGLAAGPDGAVWFGTTRGAIRRDESGFHYRQGPRWLPQDEVRSLVVDQEGTAWFATGGGLGAITRRGMTLATKAEFYEAEIERHIKRTPYGYVAEAPLRVPGDRASAARHDSDNDGLWTAMYGAAQCFAHGATGDPRARERARQAFTALRFLQTVTQDGTHSPPRGYVARTILPGDGPDPNAGRLAQDREKRKDDALWKIHEPRWPRSADGKWYWKSDTSSDELDGHYFFYPLYHDLVATTEAERDEVRAVVRDLTDHLITHGFTLTDHDGQPTRWGMYRPEVLNRDPNWWAERGLNSLSLLSYLAVARHVTGDAKYEAIARELIDRHGYAQNLLYPKVQSGPGSGNQSDDEMAFMCFYSLLRHTRDEALRNVARTAFYAYWQNEAPEMNPFFNYAYAAVCEGLVMRNQWGGFPLSPYGDWRGDSLATLRGFPLDRLNWPLRNAHRLDMVRLPLAQSRDFYEPGNEGRGHRPDGRVLPVENRHFNHWNTDPWQLDYGGRGDVLGSGTVFLLPYYMGLYHGYIAKP